MYHFLDSLADSNKRKNEDTIYLQPTAPIDQPYPNGPPHHHHLIPQQLQPPHQVQHPHQLQHPHQIQQPHQLQASPPLHPAAAPGFPPYQHHQYYPPGPPGPPGPPPHPHPPHYYPAPPPPPPNASANLPPPVSNSTSQSGSNQALGSFPPNPTKYVMQQDLGFRWDPSKPRQKNSITHSFSSNSPSDQSPASNFESYQLSGSNNTTPSYLGNPPITGSPSSLPPPQASIPSQRHSLPTQSTTYPSDLPLPNSINHLVDSTSQPPVEKKELIHIIHPTVDQYNGKFDLTSHPHLHSRDHSQSSNTELVDVSIGPNSWLKLDPNDVMENYSRANASLSVEGPLWQTHGAISYIGITKNDRYITLLRAYFVRLLQSGEMSQFIMDESIKYQNRESKASKKQESEEIPNQHNGNNNDHTKGESNESSKHLFDPKDVVQKQKAKRHQDEVTAEDALLITKITAQNELSDSESKIDLGLPKIIPGLSSLYSDSSSRDDYYSIVEQCILAILPSQKVTFMLFCRFFKYVSPFCPVVDEHSLLLEMNSIFTEDFPVLRKNATLK
ncbi:hypothetical protein QCA50_019209 [Cerrena zonata]|uniref:Uncharacterized protein n=1 Tax=Cerrena zonata TaxID=2478898 RepID=A0AAW0FEZ1_9APHY